MPPAVVPPVTGIPASPGPSTSSPTTGATLAPHAVAGITLAGSASLVLLVLLARKLGGYCCQTPRPHQVTARPTPCAPNHALLGHSRSPTTESECSRDCATCAFRIARWDAIRHAARAARVDVDAYYAARLEHADPASDTESGESECSTELTVPTPDWGSETGEWTSTPELDDSFKFYADMFAEYAGAGSSEEFALAFDEGCKRESRAS